MLMVEGERASSAQALENARKAKDRGDVRVAQSMVAWVLQHDAKNSKAWLLMANLVENRARKAECYRRVLAVNPGNAEALSFMDQSQAHAPRPSESEIVDLAPELGGAGASAVTGEGGDPVLAQLEVSRQELLDLSLNNKLLNHRNLKSKGVEIIDELSAQLYRILVEEGRTMSFLPSKTKGEARGSGTEAQGQLDFSDEGQDETEVFDDAFALGQPDESNLELAARHTDNKLQTNYSSEDLQRRLLNSYHNARTYIEEQGVNTLFLALGMLEWYESRTSKIPHKAPLILVPVELTRTNVTARFRLGYTGEDIGENLSLRAKLHSDFSLTLPEFPDAEDLNLSRYFDQVRRVIEGQARWRVLANEIALAFFSYAKFLMFKDLEGDAWPDGARPNENCLLRGLLGEGFEAPMDLGDDKDVIDDLITPEAASHVLDADSSQALAIFEVSKGDNLVIHGPPGTGKSQTIANLIAEALATGRTVLFVSEKMAALEVVKRRLDHIGLGDACLELHSRNTKKKALLDELERCIRLGKPNGTGQIDIKSLERTQAELNAYARAVNREIGQSKVTTYEAYGQLIRSRASLDGTKPPKLEIDKAETWPRDKYLEARGVAQEIQSHLSRMGMPAEHPFFASELKELLPGALEELKGILDATQAALASYVQHASSLAEELGIAAATTLSESAFMVNLSALLLDAPDLAGVNVDTDRWSHEISLIDDGLAVGIKLKCLHDENTGMVKDEAWGRDVSALQATIAEYHTKFWRMLSARFRAAKSEVQGLLKVDIGSKPVDLARALGVVEQEAELRKSMDSFTPTGVQLFGAQWHDLNSDWAALKGIALYLRNLHSRVEHESLPVEVLAWLRISRNDARLRELRSDLVNSIPTVRSTFSRATNALGFRSAGEDALPAALEGEPHDLVRRQLESWSKNLPRLQEIVTFRHLCGLAEEQQIGQLLDVALTWKGAGDHLVDLLDYAVHRQLVNRVFKERSEIKKFDGSVQETKIGRFCELDRNLLRQNQVKLAMKHYQTLPKYHAAGQLGVLSHEFQKKRRHMPIRKLMEQAGNIVQTVKPVFMMSPLSIAMYLPPRTVEFDLVIFDEASQVKPVDAFGAILRGKQIVIAGDNHQLPPTSFFDTTIDVDEDYSDSVTLDLESVLGLCLAKGLPARMLNWHYRSEHESLITVSNHEFYNDRLVIFPSPDKDKESLGLVYHHLPNAAYGRGGSRKNIEEAKAVAQAVMDHARQSPELTLGVAAFSISQADAVREQLEILRRSDPSREVFFRDHPEEQFFVKNLENVQGDERDVIYISVGYGRTPDGRVSMGFGPLNKEGGERRLNVLITRARKRCEVFTNLEPADIDLSRTRARGVEVLKRFLAYAKTGKLDIPVPSGRNPDSPFEIEVARKIRELGYQVECQVGEAGFFIDLGIVDPEQRGRYLLGIECDGATYHSAHSARERDRLRQEILERLGWKIHRIWSTDWIRNPQRELGKVNEAIERAMAQQVKPGGASPGEDAGGGDPEPAFERSAPRSPSHGGPRLAKYATAHVKSRRYKSNLHEVSTRLMAGWVEQVVNIEGPIHQEEVARRILDSAGVKRIGGRIREKFDRGVAAALRANTIEKRGKFLWKPGMKNVKPRSRAEAPTTARDIQKIPPEEIAAVIRAVVQASFGISRTDIPGEVCWLFGFHRTSQDMSHHVDSLVLGMLRSGELTDEKGQITFI
jgi:very-short-patch-repair endonuclease